MILHKIVVDCYITDLDHVLFEWIFSNLSAAAEFDVFSVDSFQVDVFFTYQHCLGFGFTFE